MVGQTPKDTPFGLDANVAAGLAYLFTLLGGLIMLFGGGTNKFVKWAAAQSITMFVLMMVLYVAAGFLGAMIHFYMLGLLIRASSVASSDPTSVAYGGSLKVRNDATPPRDTTTSPFLATSDTDKT